MNAMPLDYFIALSDAKTLSEAARKVNISQQGLSSYIKRLENHFGVPLVRRKPTMRLTPAGERVLATANRIERERLSLEQDIARLRDSETNHFTIGVMEPLMQGATDGSLIDSFIAEHADVTIEFVSGGREDIVNLVKNRKADFGITMSRSVADDIRENSDLSYYLLAITRKYLVADVELMHRYCPEADKDKGIDLATCGCLPLVLPFSSSGLNKAVRRYFEKRGIVPNIIAEGRNDQMLTSFVRNGRAAGICHEREIIELMESGAAPLSVIPITTPDLASRDVLIMNKDVVLDRIGDELVSLYKAKWMFRHR